MDVRDTTTPTIADVKRQLKNAEHELDEIAKQQNQDVVNGMVEQARYRVREAITHLEGAEGK
jgi:hypothetical protein